MSAGTGPLASGINPAINLGAFAAADPPGTRPGDARAVPRSVLQYGDCAFSVLPHQAALLQEREPLGVVEERLEVAGHGARLHVAEKTGLAADGGSGPVFVLSLYRSTRRA